MFHFLTVVSGTRSFNSFDGAGLTQGPVDAHKSRRRDSLPAPTPGRRGTRPMLPNLRTPSSQALAKMPASTRSTIDRLPSPALALAVICSLVLSGLTADRLVRVERAY